MKNIHMTPRNFKYIKGFILPFVSLLILSSCRKEVNLLSVQEKQPYLDQLVFTDDQSSTEITYKYNSDNSLSGYNKINLLKQDKGSTEIASFKRDNNGLITEVVKTLKDTIMDVPVLVSEQIKYYYNDSKQIKYRVGSLSVLADNQTFSIMDSVIYTYDSKISKFDQYVALLPDGYEHMSYGLISYDANGNKSLVKNYMYTNDVPELSNEISFSYDVNPKSLYSKDDALALDILNSYDLIDLTSTFNLITFSIDDKINPANNEAYSITYNYATDHKKPLSGTVKLNSVEVGSLKFTYTLR